MLDKFLSAVFDEQHEFNDIWELKLIKFDADLDENLKPYEKHLGISDMVEDTKGNPGLKGFFSLSNLRIIWYAQNDKDINLSIGLDTINNVTLKSLPIAGFSELKHIITLKAVSPSQVKYEFRFSGATEKEERIFKMVIDVHKKFVETKAFRNIDTSIKLTSSEFKPMEEEDIKTTYHKCMFEENQIRRQVVIILTNIRMIIFHEKATGGSSDRTTGTNYSIPWIMIQGFSKVDRDGRDGLEVKIRGLLKNVQIFITCAHRQQFSKMHKEIVSFCQTYNKNPCLGINFTKLDSADSKILAKSYRNTEVTEIENTKVNIGRRKNAYGDKNQKGSIRDTFFNEELGLMMEQMPEGCSRKDLWEILRT